MLYQMNSVRGLKPTQKVFATPRIGLGKTSRQKIDEVLIGLHLP